MIEIQVPELLQSLPENLSDVIKPWAERTPDRMALVETSGSWTYRAIGCRRYADSRVAT